MRRNIFSFAFLAEKIRGNEGRFLFGVALISRLIVLPFSQAIESDATSRMFLAEHALNHGGALASLQWPSFHIYLLSFAQFISDDRLWGPVAISLLMGAFSVVPFYLFTKNIFNRDGAFFAALIFTLSPLIFRLSFVPLSEIYHVYFSITALWLLSEGIVRNEKKWKWGILAGLSATVAAGGRFEAWVLIGLLGIILFSLREWKMMFGFGFAASIFPIWWMIFCYKMSRNPLISLEMVEWQNFVVGKVNENITEIEKFRRIIFFPLSWVLAITPVVAFISVWVFIKAIIKRKITRAQLAFGCLFFFFVPFFIYESITGSLADQHRYTVTLLMFSTPFYAMWFADGRKIRFKKIVSLSIALLIIPWSYCFNRLPWHLMFLASDVKSDAVAQIVVGTQWQMVAVPSFYEPRIGTMSDTINNNLKPADGFFIDFVGWCETYYFAQRSPLNVSDMHLTAPGGNLNGENGRMQEHFVRHPTGLILLGDFSAFSFETKLSGSMLTINGVESGLLLYPVYTTNHMRLFRYFYLSKEAGYTIGVEQIGGMPLFTPVKDVEYYMRANYGDEGWLAGTWKESLKKWTKLETEVRKNAVYMVEIDKEKQAQEKNNSDSIKK